MNVEKIMEEYRKKLLVEISKAKLTAKLEMLVRQLDKLDKLMKDNDIYINDFRGRKKILAHDFIIPLEQYESTMGKLTYSDILKKCVSGEKVYYKSAFYAYREALYREACSIENMIKDIDKNKKLDTKDIIDKVCRVCNIKPITFTKSIYEIFIYIIRQGLLRTNMNIGLSEEKYVELVLSTGGHIISNKDFFENISKYYNHFRFSETEYDFSNRYIYNYIYDYIEIILGDKRNEKEQTELKEKIQTEFELLINACGGITYEKLFSSNDTLNLEKSGFFNSPKIERKINNLQDEIAKLRRTMYSINGDGELNLLKMELELEKLLVVYKGNDDTKLRMLEMQIFALTNKYEDYTAEMLNNKKLMYYVASKEGVSPRLIEYVCEDLQNDFNFILLLIMNSNKDNFDFYIHNSDCITGSNLRYKDFIGKKIRTNSVFWQILNTKITGLNITSELSSIEISPLFDVEKELTLAINDPYFDTVYNFASENMNLELEIYLQKVYNKDGDISYIINFLYKNEEQKGNIYNVIWEEPRKYRDNLLKYEVFNNNLDENKEQYILENIFPVNGLITSRNELEWVLKNLFEKIAIVHPNAKFVIGDSVMEIDYYLKNIYMIENKVKELAENTKKQNYKAKVYKLEN